MNRTTELWVFRLLPALVFTLLLSVKIALFVRPHAISSFHSLAVLDFLRIFKEILVILFLSIQVVLFLIRLPIQGQRSSILASVIALTGTFLMTLPFWYRSRPEPASVLLLSAVLVSLGTGFSIICVTTLGRCFGLTPEARGLVTHGPYRWVRHPLYLGEGIALLGVVIASSSTLAFIVFPFHCYVQYWRTVLEERVLEAAFPQYADYRRYSYRLIPGVL